MIINVTYKTTVAEVQRKMSNAFPFLKIEFSKALLFDGERITGQKCYDNDAILLEIANGYHPTWVVLYPWYTVKYVTEIFKTKLGLHAQIFRRESNQWIQVVSDDALTLQEQNQIAKDITFRAGMMESTR